VSELQREREREREKEHNSEKKMKKLGCVVCYGMKGVGKTSLVTRLNEVVGICSSKSGEALSVSLSAQGSLLSISDKQLDQRASYDVVEQQDFIPPTSAALLIFVYSVCSYDSFAEIPNYLRYFYLLSFFVCQKKFRSTDLFVHITGLSSKRTPT